MAALLVNCPISPSLVKLYELLLGIFAKKEKGALSIAEL
jgi:hypothetical protein